MTITDWIQAISTVVLVVVTVIYAWHTRKMAEEMREQRYDSVRPIVDIQWKPGLWAEYPKELAYSISQLVSEGCTCVLRNIGLGPAIDVYSFVPSSSGERQVYDLGTLPIEREAQPSSLDSLPTQFPATLSPKREGERLVIEIHYRDVYGQEFQSNREIIGRQGDWKLGPLQACFVKENQNDS